MPKTKVPSKLKIIRGTNQPCRMIPNEVDYAKIISINPPSELNQRGKEEWLRILPILQAKQLATQADYLLLLEYCYLFSKMVYCFEKAKENDTFIGNYEGIHVTNPYHKEYLKIAVRWNNVCAKFGFSPADRTRISMPSKEKEETLADSFIRKTKFS